MKNKQWDLVVKNVRVVRPQGHAVHEADIAIQGGKFARIAPGIPAKEAKAVHDGKGLLAFPGVVDAHTHAGIYSPLQEDAVSESRAAAQGGVTSMINYFRTGQYYLNKGGPYRKFFPEVLQISKGRFHVDYAYHLAPMDSTHIKEIPTLIEKHGVSSFKIFMFYGSHGLHGRSDSQRDFLMIGPDERYDYAHFEFIMRGVQAAREKYKDKASQISLSLHCETAEIMTAYTKIVEQSGQKGLPAYHASRPPHSEGLAVFIASYLAHETALPNINLLHLSSRKALEAALQMQAVFPHIDFRREVTIGHLVLDVNSKAGSYAKVNPPIRPREDVEYLWEQVLAGNVHWVVSDHACCRHETKVAKKAFGNIWLAKSGFGGTEYLLPALISEGTRRGLSLNRIAALTSLNPAKRFGLNSKGDIAEGLDADLALVDPADSWTIRAKDSESTQGYTPFEGIELSAKVKATFLRGEVICESGKVSGKPRGAGAEVLVLERDASPSGSTALSSGFIPAAATRFQRAKDSAAQMAADIQRKNHGEADARIVEAVCRASGPTIEWLADKHGIPFQLVEGFLYPGHTVERMHCVPEKTGAALMARLLAACRDVDILTSAQVTDVDRHKVEFQRPDGTREEVEYGALVLACSGFGGNREMVRQYLPEIADALYFGHAGNQGDAVRWGTALGARTAGMSAYQGHGSVATPHGILITWALMTEGGIQVNERGERFANEHVGYSEACLPVLRQPGGVAWCVYDERLHQLGMTFPDYRDAADAGAIRRDFSPAGLSRTLEAVARYADGKEKDPFGRDFTTKPKLQPPYYAIKITGALFHTQGGLVVDERARVLPNVFAGGGAACGLSGNHVWGYLSGNGLLSAVVLGRIAGTEAARA